MDYCGGCGHPLRVDAQFCGHCGGPAAGSGLLTAQAPVPAGRPTRPVPPPAPPQPGWPAGPPAAPVAAPRRQRIPWRAGLAAAAVLATVTGVVLFVNRPDGEANGTALPESPTVATAPAVPTGVAPSRPAAAPSGADLDRQVAADRAAAERVVGSWVPQLSSRRVGMVIDGETVDADAIARDFAASRGQFAESVLVRSQDYSSFREAGYLVTLVALPFSSAEAANAWCESAGRGPDDCFAKRLSHTDGPTGNTVHR